MLFSSRRSVMESFQVRLHFHSFLFACLCIIGLSGLTRANNTTLEDAVQVCQEKPNQLNASYAGFLVVVVIVTVAGNGLVVVVMTMSRILRSQTTNLFLRSLAVTDILIGSVSLPIKIKQSLQNQYFCMSESFCWFFFFADTTLSIASVTHLLIIAGDRFIAMRYTYIYEKLMSKRRVYIVIICTWVYSFVWSCLNIVDWTNPNKYGVEWIETPVPTCSTGNRIYFTTLYVALFLVPIIIMIVMYGYVYRQVVRHIRAITLCEVEDGAMHKESRRRRREMKALRAIMVVFVAFCICWIPAVGVALSGFWDLDFWRELYVRDKRAFNAIFVVCVQVLPPFNSTLNPFIYAVFNDQFRIAFRGLLHRLRGKEGALTLADRRMTFFSEKPIALKQSFVVKGAINENFAEDLAIAASHQTQGRFRNVTQTDQTSYGALIAEQKNLECIKADKLCISEMNKFKREESTGKSQTTRL